MASYDSGRVNIYIICNFLLDCKTLGNKAEHLVALHDILTFDRRVTQWF